VLVHNCGKLFLWIAQTFSVYGLKAGYILNIITMCSSHFLTKLKQTFIQILLRWDFQQKSLKASTEIT